jgi:hypothetical protein
MADTAQENDVVRLLGRQLRRDGRSRLVGALTGALAGSLIVA